MPKWLQKELQPGEVALAWYGLDRKWGIWLGLLAMLTVPILTGLSERLFDHGFVASILLQTPLFMLPILAVKFLSSAAITDRRLLDHTGVLFSGRSESLELGDIESLELKLGHWRDNVIVTGLDGTKLHIGGVRHPADFLETLLRAHPYRDLTVKGVPTRPLVRRLSPILLWARVLAALGLAYGLGATLWDLLANGPNPNLLVQLPLFLLVIVLPVLVFLGALILLQGLSAVVLSRFVSSDDLCRILIHIEPPSGQNLFERYFRWALDLNRRLFSWLYGRPVTFWTPPTTTVSSPVKGRALRYDATVD